MPELITGDDTDLRLTLQNADFSPCVLTGATSVKVALVNVGRTAVLAGPYTASSGYAGASWAVGVVVVPIPGTDTTALTDTLCEIEVQAILADGSRKSWVRLFDGAKMIITRGFIS